MSLSAVSLRVLCGALVYRNASQVSDGAAAVILMKRSKAQSLGLPIMGAYRGFQVVGVQPDEMGVGQYCTVVPYPYLCSQMKWALVSTVP